MVAYYYFLLKHISEENRRTKVLTEWEKLTPSQQLARALERIKIQDFQELQRKININSILREYQRYKKNKRLQKSESFVTLFLTIVNNNTDYSTSKILVATLTAPPKEFSEIQTDHNNQFTSGKVL